MPGKPNTLLVTAAEVAAAKLAVRMAERAGREPSKAVRAISEALPEEELTDAS